MKDGLTVPLLPLLPASARTRRADAARAEAYKVRGSGSSGRLLRTGVVALAALGLGCIAEVDGNQDLSTDVTLGIDTNIFGGEGDNDARALASVVALKIGTGTTFDLCSGVLVAPNVVLTARHCVATSTTTTVSCDENGRSTNGSHVSGEHRPDAVAIYTGASPKFGQEPDAVGAHIVAPRGEYLCDSDIALVVLDRKMSGIEPVAVRLDGRVRPGETVRSVGYGQNDKSLPIGTRFRKPNVAVLATGRGVSRSKTALGPHEFEVGQSICQGDSGGPAISEQTGAVVGVVSRGGNCDEDFGHIYTTTTGWTELFDDAFAIAGGGPTVEAGQPSGSESGPRAKRDHAAFDDDGANAGSCSTGHGRPSGPVTCAAVLACAIVLGARSRRTQASAD